MYEVDRVQVAGGKHTTRLGVGRGAKELGLELKGLRLKKGGEEWFTGVDCKYYYLRFWLGSL